MMGQQQTTMELVAALRRIMLVVLVAALMALVMAASATAAFAAPNRGEAANDGSAADQCGQAPGQSINNADHPTSEPFGQAVKHKCAPGQQT